MCSRNCRKLERAGHTSRWGGFGEDMVVEQKPGKEVSQQRVLGAGADGDGRGTAGGGRLRDKGPLLRRLLGSQALNDSCSL